MILNDHFDVDAEIAAARIKINRAIDRAVHFQARSEGQKRRQAKARALNRPMSIEARLDEMMFQHLAGKQYPIGGVK